MGASIVIPCYNVERYVERCVDAIKRQTHAFNEIIAVDDGSTDRTGDILATLPVKIARHEHNKGLSAARNTGIRRSRGDVVAFLDADCLAKPDWLRRVMHKLKDRNVAGVGGKLTEKNEGGPGDKWRYARMQQHWGDRECKPPFLFGSNNVYRKKVLREVGLFDERYRTNYEDVDIGDRIRKKGYELIYTPDAVVEHIRRDSVASILETYWRWCHSGKRTTSLMGLTRRVAGSFRLGFNMFAQDLLHFRPVLIPIDILLIPFFVALHVKRFESDSGG